MITVRDATIPDASAEAAVHIATWQAAYAHAFPQAYLAALDHDAWTANHRVHIQRSPPRISLVAVDDSGEIVGFTHAGPRRVASPPQYDPEGGEVYAIYVHPDAWGTGAGRALMQAAVDRLATVGRRDICLWVLDDNPRARRFYERFGFTPSGETSTYTIDRGGPHETTATEVRYELTVG
jgi:GNAT superfamily N-acetyltransferase